MIGDTLLLLIPSVNDYQEIEPILDRFIVRGILKQVFKNMTQL